MDDIRYMSYEQRIAEGYAIPGRKPKDSKPSFAIRNIRTGRVTEVSEREAETMIATGRYQRVTPPK